MRKLSSNQSVQHVERTSKEEIGQLTTSSRQVTENLIMTSTISNPCVGHATDESKIGCCNVSPGEVHASSDIGPTGIKDGWGIPMQATNSKRKRGRHRGVRKARPGLRAEWYWLKRIYWSHIRPSLRHNAKQTLKKIKSLKFWK